VGQDTRQVSLWDLRRGDADDDRTSPHGRGWRGIILSSALEFNYLTASLAFLLLIIVPAVVVGLVPLLVAELGRGQLTAASQILSRPVSALISLAISAGVVLWIARPLVPRAIDFFWHLHYTLICPIFVGLREVFSALIERLPGLTTTPEQIDRRRRFGTLLAAIVFAGGSLLIARAIGFTSGHELVGDWRRGFWPFTRDVLGNAAVVLSLSTVGASLIWFWREVSSRRPVLNWAPGAPATPHRTARVAHLSDLHLVGERYGYRMEAGTAGPQGNRRVRDTLRKLHAIHVESPLDHVVVTGDITDAGTRAEWAAFLDLLRRHPDLRERLLFVPGNHDVNVIDRANPGRFALPWSEGEALRKLRVVLTLDEVHGDDVYLVDRRTGTAGASLRTFLREGDRAGRLQTLAERGGWRGRLEMMHTWDRIWPLVVPPPADGSPGVVLLDSNARRHISVTNAVGVIGRPQLKALKSVLRASRDRAWMVLLHHQVAEYPVPMIGLADRIGLALVNAPDVLDAIAAHGAPVVVMHGHRHWDWIGTRGAVVLCSAPSASMGAVNTDKSSGSFHIYELACDADGGMQLMTSERVVVH
jgi:3',5'-cyclic AMP phosphodiesterase CpdA